MLASAGKAMSLAPQPLMQPLRPSRQIVCQGLAVPARCQLLSLAGVPALQLPRLGHSSDRPYRNCRCSAGRKTDKDSSRVRIPEMAPPPGVNADFGDPQWQSAAATAQLETQFERNWKRFEQAWTKIGFWGQNGIMFGIALLIGTVMSWNINRELPMFQPKGMDQLYLQTDGGAMLPTFSDKAGRIFWFDPSGALWYDSGSQRVGFYVIAKDGFMINVFLDPDGNLQHVPVGNIKDIREVEFDEIGGVPVEEIDEATGNRSKFAYGFFSDDNVNLPADAPLTVDKDGNITGPPMLEEGVILLERRKNPEPWDPSEPDPLEMAGALTIE